MALIMLVGGSDSSRARASAVLEAHGYEVEQSHAVSEASSRLMTLSPALVVVDTLMSDGDPIACVRALRRRVGVAVIVCDRHRGRSRAVEALEAGADDYLDELCSSEELALRVAAILRRYRGNQVEASGPMQR
jgi:DNA-binding response OmpR family regulator